MIRILPHFYALSATGSTKREHLPSGDLVNVNYGPDVAAGQTATLRGRKRTFRLAKLVKNDIREVAFFRFLTRR